jgi:hypothetical protein
MYIDLIQARAQYAHIRLRELRFMTYFYSSNLGVRYCKLFLFEMCATQIQS